MTEIRKAYRSDFERLTPLFSGFRNPPPRQHLMNLFRPRWNSPEMHCGYIMEEDGRAVGFLGTIFSRRPTPRGEQTFCNLSLWHVLPEYRSESLLLLMQVLRMQDVTITNFTGNKVAPILRKFGFRQVDERFMVALPLPAFSVRTVVLLDDPAAMRPYLSGPALQVLDDHTGLPCHHLMIRKGAGVCHLLYNLVKKKGLPVLQVLYLSDADFFFQNLGAVCARICFSMKLAGVMVGDHLVGDRFLPGALWVKQKEAHLFRSQCLDRYDIDLAYSEIQLFDLH